MDLKAVAQVLYVVMAKYQGDPKIVEALRFLQKELCYVIERDLTPIWGEFDSQAFTSDCGILYF